MRRTVGHVLVICTATAYNRAMTENGHTVPMAPINLNIDNLIHCINRDQREADLLAEYRVQRAARRARERGRWSDAR